MGCRLLRTLTILFLVSTTISTPISAQVPTIFGLVKTRETPFIWTGLAGDNNWGTAGNWSTSVTPGAADVARFEGEKCSAGNCNVTVNVNVDVAGVDINSTFPGTITQAAGITISVQGSGWNQAAGTFIGGNSQILITGGSFVLSGGTFNSTSDNLKIAAASGAGYVVFNQSGGTFNAGMGTLYLTHAPTGCTTNDTHYTLDINGTIALNNLRYAGGHPAVNNRCHWDFATGDVVNIAGSFNITRDHTTGTIAANTAGGTDTFTVGGNLTYGSGANGGTLAVTLNGIGTQNLSQTSGTTQPSGVLKINKSSGSVTQTTNITLNNANLDVTQGTFDQVGFSTGGISVFYLRNLARWRSTTTGTLTATAWINDLGCVHELYGSGNMNFSWITNCDLHFNKNGGNYVQLSGNTRTYGNLLITSGSLRGLSYILTVGKDWSNSATFTPGTSTVLLTGTNNTISGSNTFYNLTKTVTAPRTLTFAAGTTQTVTNTLTLTGSSAANKLSLRSSSPGTQWNINPQGTRTVQYLDVQDSNNTNAAAIPAGATSVDSGNNTNWTF